jgi:hypothetical protein
MGQLCKEQQLLGCQPYTPHTAPQQTRCWLRQVVALSTSGMLAAPADALSMKRMTKAGLTQEDAALKLGLEVRVARLKAELEEARVQVEAERSKWVPSLGGALWASLDSIAARSTCVVG